MDEDKKIAEALDEVVEEVKSSEEVSKVKKSKNKTLLNSLIVSGAIIVIAIILFMAGVFGGVKDIEMASVNGEVITESFFNEFYAQQEVGLVSQGLDITDLEQLKAAKERTLNTLIDQALLKQEAVKAGVIIDDELLQSEYDRTVEQFESEEAFQAALTENSMTPELLRHNILTQLTIQQYLTSNIDQNVEVSDGEVQELYDQYVAQGGNVPPFEEIQTQLEDQVKQQKIDSQIAIILNTIKETSEIELYLD